MSGAPTTPTWVLGAHGLLGSHLTAALRRRSAPVLTTPVPWGDSDGTRRALSDGVRRLETAAAGGPWQLAWCAGAGDARPERRRPQGQRAPSSPGAACRLTRQ